MKNYNPRADPDHHQKSTTSRPIFKTENDTDLAFIIIYPEVMERDDNVEVTTETFSTNFKHFAKGCQRGS